MAHGLKRAVVVLASLAVSCSTSSTPTGGIKSAAPATASASRSGPTPTAPPTGGTARTPGSLLALLVSFPHGNAQGNTGYDLTLLDTGGTAVAKVHAAARTFIASSNPSDVIVMPLPEVTASSDRAYYLDGDTDVHYLAVDGSTGLVTHVPGSASAYAAFSVSPDDSRIVVSVMDFSRRPVAVRLYVENLDGSNHKELFNSTSDYVWPVGWHAGLLVLASAQGTPYAVGGNPYGAPAYHVVDPGTALRAATIGGDAATNCAPVGPLTSVGTACWMKPSSNSPAVYTALDWSGRKSSIRMQVEGAPGDGALSADGAQIAACCDAKGDVSVLIPGGVRFATGLTGQDGICWLDSGHLYNGPWIPSERTAEILDLRRNMDDPAGALMQVKATGYCAGLLPQDFG